MWSAIRWLVLRIAAVRWLFKLSGLAFLLPLALLLKTIGLPLLAILSVLALPILVLLFLFGLPVFLVLLFGGMFMGMIGVVLTIGLAAIKIGLFVVLPLGLAWKLGSMLSRCVFKRGGDGGAPGDSSTGSSSPPASPPSSSTSSSSSTPDAGLDPAL
jgi:hypothetical protein